MQICFGGLGYGNSIFYPDIFLYLPAILHLIGLTLIMSYKIFIILITFMTYIAMYKTARTISNKISTGIITSILYTFALYRMELVYTRAALGEILAMAFLPLVVLGLYHIVYKEDKKWYILALGIFGVANSHIISVITVIIFIIGFLLLNIKKLFKEQERLKKVLFAGIISITLLSSVFIPIVEQETNAVHKVFAGGTSRELSETALSINRIFDSEFRDTEIGETMSVGNGVIILIIPLSIILIKTDDKDRKKMMSQLALLGYIFLIMTTKLFPWKYFTTFNFIQLPWRLNIIVTLSLSLVSGYILGYIIKDKKWIIALTLIILFIITGYNLSHVKYIEEKDTDKEYDDIGCGEYLPEYNFKKESAYVYDIDNNEIKYSFTRKDGTLEFDLTDEKNSKKINIPFFYYTGYKAYVVNNDKEEQLKIELNDEDGMLLLNNPELKTGRVKVQYKITIVQTISYIITYTSLISLIIYVIIDKRKNKKL